MVIGEALDFCRPTWPVACTVVYHVSDLSVIPERRTDARVCLYSSMPSLTRQLMSFPMASTFPLRLIFALTALATCGCQGPQGANLGTHVGTHPTFGIHTGAGATRSDGTGMPRDPSLSGARQVIDSGTYLYHEPATGKTAPFKIGMSRAAAESVIRAQGIITTREQSPQSGSPTVLVLGPGGSSELLVKLRFVNDKLLEIEVPA